MAIFIFEGRVTFQGNTDSNFSYVVEVIHQLDEKYLPAGVGGRYGGFDLVVCANHSEGTAKILKGSYADVVSKYTSNYFPVIAVFFQDGNSGIKQPMIDYYEYGYDEDNSFTIVYYNAEYSIKLYEDNRVEWYSIG